FGLAVIEIVKHWDTIKNGFQAVLDFFTSIGTALYDAIKGPFEKAFDWIKAVYDKTIGPVVDAIRYVAGIGGGTAGPGSTQFGTAPGGSTVYGGGRAGGGGVSAGTAYTVGERGPELFVPGRSGSIVPNGGGMTINVYALDPQGA